MYMYIILFTCYVSSSTCRTKILVQDLTTKQEQLESLKQQIQDLEGEFQSKEREVTQTHLKFSDLVTQMSSFQTTLQIQRTALNDIKVSIQENYQNITEQHRKVVNNVALSCEKFAQEQRDLVEHLRKVRYSYRVIRGQYKTWPPPPIWDPFWTLF